MEWEHKLKMEDSHEYIPTSLGADTERMVGDVLPTNTSSCRAGLILMSVEASAEKSVTYLDPDANVMEMPREIWRRGNVDT